MKCRRNHTRVGDIATESYRKKGSSVTTQLKLVQPMALLITRSTKKVQLISFCKVHYSLASSRGFGFDSSAFASVLFHPPQEQRVMSLPVNQGLAATHLSLMGPWFCWFSLERPLFRFSTPRRTQSFGFTFGLRQTIGRTL